MTLKAPAAPGIITVTQGGNDAFVQGSLLTGLQSRQAYNLRGIAWQFTSAIVSAHSSRYQFCLSRRSKAAMPTLADIDVLAIVDWQTRFVTSGLYPYQQSGYIILPAETPIVEDTLYLDLDTDSTSAAATLVVRLDWELDTISDIDKLNLIARSLT